ncbi:MAG: hypothetical protein LWW85_04010 [Marinilabiliales bacterium]|nr:hypothetical protein [Marinilabiliales bacterium]
MITLHGTALFLFFLFFRRIANRILGRASDKKPRGLPQVRQASPNILFRSWQALLPYVVSVPPPKLIYGSKCHFFVILCGKTNDFFQTATFWGILFQKKLNDSRFGHAN